MTTPKPSMSWIGHAISNRYKIETLLGQGGMSEVYRAYDPNLARSVAIKLIHRHLSNDPEFVRRFEQEARAVAQLRHPNIIQVYDFDHDSDFYYMVLEYVQGKTLQDKLKTLSDTHQRLPLSDTIRIMADICEAVAYAHYKGMIHRDLKPANVMLKSKEQPSQLEQPILMDFGVAKMLSGTQYTATGAFIGTAKYMSPEQAEGDRPDERTDIYSLGVMLFEMVIGRAPFEADSTIATLMKHVTEPVPDIRQIQSDVPSELVTIIEKALVKEPKDRYQTAAEMTFALETIDLQAKKEMPTKGTQTPLVRERHHTEPALPKPTPADPTPRSVPSTNPAAQSVQPHRRLFGSVGALAIGLILMLILGLGAFFLARPLQPSGGVTEKTLPLSKGMVRIDGGIYTIGLDPADTHHAATAQVELTEFWIDQYEVTNAQYTEFLKATNKQAPTDWPEGQIPTGQEENPVKGISWDTAVTYCEYVDKRLPTEAEWEIAARGLERRLYPWGNDLHAVKLPQSGTYKVGSKPTNQSTFGVFDMAGNVWEWVGETYAPVEKADHRVLHGGANDLLKDMAYRLQGDPNAPTMFASSGIRCAADQVKIVEVDKVEDGSVLYQDNFAEPGSGWPILAEGTYFFGYHPPDFYHIEIHTGGRRTAITRKANYGDVSVEAEVLVDHTDTENGDFRYGLVLRRSAEDQFYAFTISPRKGAWYIFKNSPSGLEVLAEGTVNTLQGFAPSGFTPDKADILRVDANGANFVFYINGQRMSQVSASDYTDGEIGFYVETLDETLAHIHFDSLTIREAVITQEVQPQAEVAAYQDNFDNPGSGWPISGSGTSLFGYHPPDYYHVEIGQADNWTAVTRKANYGDVSVEAEVLVDHTDTENGDFRYGLVLRRSAEDQFYAFTISPRKGAWYVLKRSPSGFQVLMESATDTLRGIAPQGLSPDKTDTLRVEASGQKFVFYINGQAVASVNDADYANGEVGFYVETLDETLAHVHYDSLVIWEAEAK